MHHVSLQVCLEVLKLTDNVVTLVDAVDSPLDLQTEPRALRQIHRMSRSPSLSHLLCRINISPRTHISRPLRKFDYLIGAPSSDTSAFPPQGFRSLPPIVVDFPGLRKGSNIPDPVSRFLVVFCLCEAFYRYIKVFMEGSVDPKRTSASQMWLFLQ